MSAQLSAAGDVSVGTQAIGLFDDGTLVVKDGSDANLLVATLQSLVLEEVGNGLGLLQGYANFVVTGGSLADDFPLDGELVQIVYSLNPQNIDDFSTPFSGFSNVTLMPIPEPGTIFLVGTGLLVAAGYLRRRRLS